MYGMLSPVASHVDNAYDERHPFQSFSTGPPSPFHEHASESPFTSSYGDFDIGIPSLDQPERAPPPDAIPNPEEGQDLAFDDESLSTLEKIYLLARSKASFHRIYIAHQLTSYLPDVTPGEAVEYVLPLLSGLAMDEEESVKEALAAELFPVMWWFISNCRVVEDEAPSQEYEPRLPVTAFTPILGTLLLSPNRAVGTPARAAVVDILAHIRATLDQDDSRIFGKTEKLLFEREMLYQVVIGMGRLDQDGDQSRSEDDDDDDRPEVWWTAPSTPANPELFASQRGMDANVNPYFPALPAVQEESMSPSPPASVAESLQSTPSSGTPTPVADTVANPLDSRATTLSQETGTPSPPSISPHSSASSRSPRGDTPDLSPASTVTVASPTSPPEPVSPVQSPVISTPQVREEVDIGPSSQSSDRWASGISDHDLSELSIPSGREQVRKVDVGLDDQATDSSSDLEESVVDAGEQAAIGKVSSMSLMAALSATCTLQENVQTVFVREVERVGRDPTYWVRREATFALGALAKVVPLEIVMSSLLPLFEVLCVDTEWHVRHSAIFALPGLLSRLPPVQRRLLAVKTIPPLARDSEAAVRSGLLEALGEVIYTFHDDKDGPPDELLDLFLGRKPSDGRYKRRNAKIHPNVIGKSPWLDDDSILLGDDPSRLLICAFNFPAVTLTLGRARWGELRESYLALAKDLTPRVRQTLAASVGEMAKIIGPDHSKWDLMPLWLDSIKFDDSEVRLKAAESVVTLVGALCRPERVVVVQSLQQAWSLGHLRGWRERDVAANNLEALVGLVNDTPSLLRSLLKLALQDDVAAVRAAAVSTVPVFFRVFAQRRDVLDTLRDDVKQMASSPAFRKRNTYIACQEALVLSEATSIVISDTELWRTLAMLANDSIVDVRIGVSRLIRRILDKPPDVARPLPKHVLDVVTQLRTDQSPQVRSFVPNSSESRLLPSEARRLSPDREPSIFSRPPPSERTMSGQLVHLL
ncbi:ARM repeat-containing protein [Neolentinus lepideus HHB14362 ss-1]|uniref:ARM repeat-containing protein n=1 Tax=Neolentinus lepideus HHB14362 ss-1 TaxID=1314782 RepID=A0A165T8G0_9AGAM|nr:ARM repeat-containing protein [Neolentinus lepideus HHB14362 ss-1]